MKRLGCLLLFAMMMIMTALFAQTASKSADTKPVKKNPLEAYAGTWTATLDGNAWMTVRLTLQGQQLTGSVQRPQSLKINDDGEVKSVSEERLNEAVENSQINGDGVLLTAKGADAKESDRFLLRLTGDNTAEMKMLAMSMPPGMAKPRPWKLTRAAGTAAPAAR
jgi:lipocalin